MGLIVGLSVILGFSGRVDTFVQETEILKKLY